MNRTYIKDNKKLIYTQIDIPVSMPPIEDILDWHNNHCMLDTDYEDYQQGRHIYSMVCYRAPLNEYQWRHWDPTLFRGNDSNWRDYVEGANLYWAPDFKERFPTIVEGILKLPFKQIAGAGMMFQIGNTPAHFDTFDKNNPMEPRRYNMYITDPAYNTFWLAHDDTSIKHYPTVDRNYPFFAFNNWDIQHGTDWPNNLKIVMGIQGIIDNDRHEELIERSVNKYPEKAIWI